MGFRVVSWNVNGLRACLKKGPFVSWFSHYKPEILCLQELFSRLKAEPHQVDLSGVIEIARYHWFWNSSIAKKGYSGTLVLTQKEPLAHWMGIGDEKFDTEGRVITLEFEKFFLVNVYKPSCANLGRLSFRQEFDEAFLGYVSDKRSQLQKPAILCGDFNVAHSEIDLARPFENHELGGFTTIERNGLTKLTEIGGFLDSFRHVHGNKEQCYSFWNYRNQSRINNKGWRIDYVFLDKKLEPHLKDAFILADTHGSDHCPVGVTIDNALLNDASTSPLWPRGASDE